MESFPPRALAFVLFFLHHGFYDGVAGALQQQSLVPVGVHGVGQFPGAAVVGRAGTGAATDWGGHRLDPLRRDNKNSLNYISGPQRVTIRV